MPPVPTVLPAYSVHTLMQNVPQGPAACFTTEAQVWYGHKGTVANAWNQLNASQTVGVPVSVTLSQGTANISTTQSLQLSATTYNQANQSLTGRSYTWASTATAVATVNASGLVSPVAAGTTTITATDTGVVGACVVTVTVTTSNEPAGTTNLINGAALNMQPPAAGGQVSVGGASWSMFSPLAISSTGETSTNLTLDLSGSGWRVNYPTNLSTGNSPVRIGTNLAALAAPIGQLYVRFKLTFSSNWFCNVPVGVKMFEPRVASQGSGALATENHILPMATYVVTNNPAILQLQGFLQGPNSQSLNLPPSSGAVGIVTGGQQHLVEMLLSQDNPAGSGNGQLQIWTDGALTVNKTGLTVMAAGNPLGYSSFLMDPVYGGIGGQPPVAMYWTFDNMYISVK